MTGEAKKVGDATLQPVVSTSAALPFDPATLAQGVRVSQASFARMAGVSRQTVSQWVKKGKIRSIYPDGSLDPVRAAQDVIRNTDPAKLRAKVFKVATEDAQALRQRVTALEADAKDWRGECQRLEQYLQDFSACLLEGGVSAVLIDYAHWWAEGGKDAPADPDETESQPGPLFAE